MTDTLEFRYSERQTVKSEQPVYQCDHGWKVKITQMPDIISNITMQYSSGDDNVSSIVENQVNLTENSITSSIPEGLLYQQNDIHIYLYFNSEYVSQSLMHIILPVKARTPINTL